MEYHLVDYNALVSDDFDSYFIARAKCIMKVIEKAMGKTSCVFDGLMIPEHRPQRQRFCVAFGDFGVKFRLHSLFYQGFGGMGRENKGSD